jgi:CheY-like chemotaxis protein
MALVRNNPYAVVPFSTNTADENTAGAGAPPNRNGLAQERAAAQARLDALDAELERLESERGLRDAFAAEAPERLHVLANMGPGLLTPLHAVLGYAQILRMDRSLSAQQAKQVDALFAAALHLRGCVQHALSLAELHGHPADIDGDEDVMIDAACLPVAYEPAADGAAAAFPAPGLHVLLADDVAMSREIAAAFLREAGYSVSLAESGAEAVSIAASSHVDVILMDVRMPEMDGLEATRHIRQLPGEAGSVPIIALTALSFTDDVEICRKMGMNGHLAKPFSRETLIDAVTRAIAPKADQGWIMANPPSPAAAVRSAKPLAIRAEADWRLPVPRLAAEPVTPAWLDIDNPWNRASQRPPASARPGTSGSCFAIKLTLITVNGKQRLFNDGRACAPQAYRDRHGFHWLVFLPRDLEKPGVFTVQCDLWRWVHGAWSSTTVAGAVFTPDEMYEQGWRYCGPCEDKTAQVEIAVRSREEKDV